MGEHVNRILCAADRKGSPESIDQRLAAAGQRGVDAIAVVGDIGGDGDGERDVFRALGHASCRATATSCARSIALTSRH